MATSRQVLREQSASELGLGMINLYGIAVDTDTVQTANIRDIIGATDNRLIEGAYFFLRTSYATAYTAAVTVSAGGATAAATSIGFSQTATAASAIKEGDIIQFTSGEMVLVTDVTWNLGTSGSVTVVRGVLGNPTAVTALSAVSFITKTQWRAILSHSFSTDRIELVRPIVGLGVLPLAFDVYFILTPKELNECVDLSLSKLWYRDRITITLTEDVNEYNITDSGTWFTDPSQLIDMSYRFTDDSGFIREVAVTNRKIISEDDEVTVTLYDIPGTTADASWELVIQGRRWYSALTYDGDTTTCPLPLAKAQIKVDILEKVFNKLGKAAKENYGMELAIAEKTLEKMKSRYRQAITHTNPVLEHPYTAVDVPVTDADWGNWV